MNKELSLKIILVISILGMLFSGYLSFGELVMKACPIGGCSALLGVPTCVFGLIMYIAIFVVSLIGIRSK